jgi:hypothetical protein
MDACPGAMDACPRAMKARPEAMEARPEVMEARPGAMDAQPGAFEDHHGAVEACPGAMESLSRAVKAHMESILAQMGAFGTIGSHPDEDYSMRSSPEWAYMAPMWTREFAALLGDEVRHNRPKFDSAESIFFGDLAM